MIFDIFSTEKIGLVSELNVTFQRIFHVKIKLPEFYAQYLFFCSIRICLHSVFFKISKISEIRRLRPATKKPKQKSRENYENCETSGMLKRRSKVELTTIELER